MSRHLLLAGSGGTFATSFAPAATAGLRIRLVNHPDIDWSDVSMRVAYSFMLYLVSIVAFVALTLQAWTAVF